MKTFAHLGLLAACAALTITPSVHAQPPSTDDYVPPPPQPPIPGYHEPGVTAREELIPREVTTFFMEAARSGMKEVAVSETVLPNLANPEVREFARRMIKDHTASNKELKALAARKGVVLPPENRNTDLIEKWSEKSDSLDQDYVEEMVSDHQKAVELFETGTKADDPQLAEFARKVLPTLKHHLEEAKRLKQAR